MAQRVHVEDFKAFRGDVVALDANVILKLFLPDFAIQRTGGAREYGSLLKKARARGCELVVNPPVISEVVNVISREAHKVWKASSGRDFKEFRRHAAFTKCAEDIELTIMELLRVAAVREQAVGADDVRRYTSDYTAGALDWTDLLLVDFCRKNSAHLATHDADFAHADVDIVTANARLLEVP